MLYSGEDVEDGKLTTSTESNLFSLLGTLILWIYWPSFMASGALPGKFQGGSSTKMLVSLIEMSSRSIVSWIFSFFNGFGYIYWSSFMASEVKSVCSAVHPNQITFSVFSLDLLTSLAIML